MLQGNVGVIAGQTRDDLPPELGDLKDVGLVHGRNPAPTLSSQFKSQPGDAFNLRFAVDVGVEPFPLTVIPGANTPGFAKIDAPGQFPDDQDVQASDQLRFQAGSRRQLGEQHGRPQVCKQIEISTYRQQAALGSVPRGQAIPLGATHGAQQDGIGRPGLGPGAFRVGGSLPVDGDAPQIRLVQRNDKLKPGRHGVQHPSRLSNNLGPDSVSGQQQDLV